MRVFILAVAFIAVNFIAVPASFAAETAEDQATENPYQPQIVDAAKNLAEELDDKQSVALSHIRNGFGMIRAVRIVKDDIGKAVKLCGEKNPAMKDEMTSGYKKWQDHVNPILKGNENALEDSINSGLFDNPAKIRDYLNLIDKAATYADEQFDKKIVTTPEACERLLHSLDDSRDQLTALLGEIEWPVPGDKTKGE